jgi:hypothetical protein
MRKLLSSNCEGSSLVGIRVRGSSFVKKHQPLGTALIIVRRVA